MKTLLLVIVLLGFHSISAEASLKDFLEQKEIPRKVREGIADLDINAKINLGDIDLVEGINLASAYKYEVEASYISKYYTRVDKWDVNAGINVGELINNFVDMPFGFSVSRNSSFLFVRQFANKGEAMKAVPYSLNKLPLNANLALKNLRPGDFVAMPANLNVAVSAGINTSMVAPMVVAAGAEVHAIVSGEFTIQVFKLDETHVRLKLLTKRNMDFGNKISVGTSFNVFGVRVLDKQIEKILEKDFVQYGLSYVPGSQFILDYVFDLKYPEAQEAYNQIVRSTFKFRDIIVTEQLLNGHELKDKLLSTYDKADELAKEDRTLDQADRRVTRIFKGFDNSKAYNFHVKLAMFYTSYTKDTSLSDNKVTFIDKDETAMEFYYPNFSKYFEAHLGKKIIDLKDQSFQNNFALIPRFEGDSVDDVKSRQPDLGMTFERKDRYFTVNEQKAVEQFILDQMPASFAREIDFSEWKERHRKYDSRFFFQLILKSNALSYLKNFTEEELKERIIAFVKEKRKTKILEDSKTDQNLHSLYLFFRLHTIEEEKLTALAEELYKTLKIEDSEQMAHSLVVLNQTNIFDKIGVGFLISLLPEDQLNNLVYMKFEMIAKDMTPILVERGTLQYKTLYKELTEIQTRLANRGYDLRLSETDKEMQETFAEKSISGLLP